MTHSSARTTSRLSSYCDGLNRREMLSVGSLGGLGLAELLWMQESFAKAKGKPVRDINCIFLFALGGQPHQDMWDVKPDAPSEIRGDFNPISTKASGIQISDVLPRISTITDKLAIMRSVTHVDSDHGRGYHVMMTGKRPGAGDFNGNQNNNHHPCLGSMVSRLGTPGELPPYISVPNFLNSGGPSFLGPSYGPFVIEADPAAPDFSVRDITLPTAISTNRNARRQAVLREINRFERQAETVGRSVRSLDTFYQKAAGLMTSKKAKEAFDIHRESDKTRAEYGMTSVGQCCLLSRRLVEAGCRFVAIENGHWDTHRKNTYSLKDLLCPSFDRAVPALLNDLEQRGMLDDTLVVISTEFGRTPQINQLAGRDHWPNVFSIAMAGGGVKGGQVIGASDRRAAGVADRPITPGDMTATVLDLMGIDPRQILHTPLGRPIPLVDDGRPITELT
ncbi:MAG TPA: DUF1501 domain-containing protein [Planctomycetaceae bacterium]|jgi:hypothetical protein|nr:hypothetical protein [Planctomycetaceae bacterium]HAA59905.1 DUF1501 domain-containing protein [Planctomycetaceae bacterium]|tara:strand:- start:4015 stop:5361 length:1347 start_codon:yes stop_codon:yes gene_type:complete